MDIDRGSYRGVLRLCRSIYSIQRNYLFNSTDVVVFKDIYKTNFNKISFHGHT